MAFASSGATAVFMRYVSAFFDCKLTRSGPAFFYLSSVRLQVCNGLLQRPPNADGTPAALVPVGILPGGSGNSISLDLGTWSLAEAARRIGRGDSVAMDAVKVSTNGGASRVASVNLVAWGLVGDVGVVAEGFRMLGPARYDAVAAWGVAKGGGWPCKIKFELADGTSKSVDEKLMTAFINSTQHFGKGLRPTPHARLDDGLMDLCYLEGSATRGEMLAILQQLPTGAHHARTKGIHMFQVRKCSMDVGGPGVVNIDGEVMQHDGKLDFSMLPRVLRVFCPGQYEPPSVKDAEAGKKKGWKI